jgi:transposase InsO family protein
MMTVEEYRHWCRRLGIKGKTRQFIDNIRNSEPVRLVRGGGNSVVGLYPSRLMGRTIQFESHRCELSSIQQMERAESDVLEIWDQPTTLTLTYQNKSGKKVTVKYVPDFFVCRKEYAEIVECKTEENLIELSEVQPNRYCRGEDGAWHSPPMEELAKELGVRYTIRTTAKINYTYIRNLDFIEDYLRMDAHLVDADAYQVIITVVKNHRGISLTDLLDYVLGQAEVKVSSDDVYLLIVRGDIYVDLDAAPLAEPERVQVFENAELSEAYVPPGGVPAQPRAKYADVGEGTRLLWDGKVWEVANIGEGRVWLLGDKTDASFPHERFEEYVASGVIELVDFAAEADPYALGLEILNNSEPSALAEAERRLEVIRPYLDKEKPLRGADKERSIRRYIAAYKEAVAYYGNGKVGLLPDWFAEGKRVERLLPEVYEIMDYRIENDYETLVQKRVRPVYGAVLNDCEARGIPETEWPSYQTFWKRVNSRPRAKQTGKRKGKKAAYQHETHVYWIDKDTPPHGDRPFQIAHADCTQIDEELVCPITGENMGRPWAAFLVDAYTRLLLAIVVTFDEPSYRTTMMLLRECVRRHKRLPQTLIVDRGKEFDNIYLRRLAGTFEMVVKFRPGSKPRHGSVGERLFGIANNEIVHNLKGNTQIMKEIRKVTKSTSPKTQAAWTLGPFAEWFTAWGYEVYNKRPHWTLQQRPIEAFARSLELTGKRRRLIPHYDEAFRILTMPTTRKRTAKNIVDKGIKINSIYYWNSVLRERSLEGKQLQVRYDPYDISIAYVQIRGRWVRCEAEEYATFRYCTERQLKIVSEELRRRHKKYFRSRPITAKDLANFIRHAEEVQKDQAELRLSNQRKKDREVKPVFMLIDGGASAHLDGHQTPSGGVADITHKAGELPKAASPFATVDAGNLGLLKVLK